ncbi:hypothetical protein CDL15_Pgr012779 [Punica granatum]|uniref:Uncharacterized protein n=1 Tax=Punica granatum TaxID=22663 RepID=A0A218XER3_PUNGR|nr:hypothetical protein CDL15_Pgr012779 [Punica granatum]
MTMILRRCRKLDINRERMVAISEAPSPKKNKGTWHPSILGKGSLADGHAFPSELKHGYQAICRPSPVPCNIGWDGWPTKPSLQTSIPNKTRIPQLLREGEGWPLTNLHSPKLRNPKDPPTPRAGGPLTVTSLQGC